MGEERGKLAYVGWGIGAVERVRRRDICWFIDTATVLSVPLILVGVLV